MLAILPIILAQVVKNVGKKNAIIDVSQ
ncbi:hypothetical protein [Psychrobacter urativorans]